MFHFISLFIFIYFLVAFFLHVSSKRECDRTLCPDYPHGIALNAVHLDTHLKGVLVLDTTCCRFSDSHLNFELSSLTAVSVPLGLERAVDHLFSNLFIGFSINRRYILNLVNNMILNL